MKTKKTTEWIFQFWAWQLLVWTLYRYFLHLPEWADEFIFKPLVFVVPVLWYVLKREKGHLSSVGLTAKKSMRNMIIGFGVGAVFLVEGVIVNVATYGSLHIQQLPAVATYSFWFLVALSLATAFSEELLSRGFFFSRLLRETKRLWYAIGMSTLMFVAFHIPILVTSLKFQGPTMILFLSTTIIIAIINSTIFFQTKSLLTPLLVHFFWNMTVALFL